MRIGMALQYSGDVVAAAEQAVALEAAGLDVAWIAEAYGFDGVSLMGYLAARTERMAIGSYILNIYSRTPGALAQTAAGLDAVSQGRFELGLGASGPQVIEGWHGMPYDKPLGRTREAVDLIRRMLRREVIEHDGLYQLPLDADAARAAGGTGLGKPLKMLTTPRRPEVPIHIASMGPKNVELTAEIANGWMPAFFHPGKAADVFGPSLDAGLAKRDEALGPLDVIAGGALAFVPEESVEAVLAFARPQYALYIGGMGAKGRNFYNDLFRRYGYEAEADEIQDLYLDGKKDEAAALIPLDFLREMNLVGPEGWVKERLAAWQDAGVTTLNLMPVGDAPQLVATVRNWLG